MDKELKQQLESVSEFLEHMFNKTGDKKYQREIKKNEKLTIEG